MYQFVLSKGIQIPPISLATCNPPSMDISLSMANKPINDYAGFLVMVNSCGTDEFNWLEKLYDCDGDDENMVC